MAKNNLPSEDVEFAAYFFTLMFKAANPKVKEALVYEILLPLFIEIEGGSTEYDADEAIRMGNAIGATTHQTSKVH